MGFIYQLIRGERSRFFAAQFFLLNKSKYVSMLVWIFLSLDHSTSADPSILDLVVWNFLEMGLDSPVAAGLVSSLVGCMPSCTIALCDIWKASLPCIFGRDVDALKNVIWEFNVLKGCQVQAHEETIPFQVLPLVALRKFGILFGTCLQIVHCMLSLHAKVSKKVCR
jgi:hypothetical protein